MKKVVLLVLILLCPVFDRAIDRIDINTASLVQLDEITGIGPTYARAIIDGRPYASIDDLLKIKGIGEKTLQKIKEQGLACVNCAVVQPAIAQPAEISQSENSGGQAYATGVFINEILPSPLGPDEQDEWFELYNSNNFEVDLSGWKISDTRGTITNYTINPSTSSGQIKISAYGFLVFKRPDTKIMLNNDGDGLSLFTPDGKIADSVAYTKAPTNQSYNLPAGRQVKPADWSWSTTLTPGAENILASKSPSASSGSGDLSKSKNSVKNNNVEASLADLSQALDLNQEEVKTINPWFLFLIAMAVTIISAAIVLFIRIRFKNLKI